MGLEIQNTPLYREIEAIVSGAEKPVHFTVEAIIHVGANVYYPLKLLSIDNLEDYELAYADTMIVELSLSAGSFSTDIYPFKDQVDITIIKKPIGEVGNNINPDKVIQSERFTAVLKDTGNPVIEGNTNATPSKDTLDLTNIINVKFQLINKAVEQIRMVTIGGIYRRVRAGELIRALLTAEINNINVEGVRKPLGVDLASGYNQEVREHILIPHGVKLIDMPAFIQNECGGVYSAGFTCYMKSDYWYVYPLFDVKRYGKADRVLNVINVPRNKFPGIERTYRQDGNNIVIMCTGEVQFSDDSESQQLVYGNGVVFPNMKQFMNGFSFTKNNKTTVSRGANNTEVISTARANGKNNVQVLSDLPASNPLVEYSRLARRQGSFLTFVWENSNPSLITPGIPVKFSYIDNNKISAIYGSVIKAHHFTSLAGDGMMASKYVNHSVVVVFVDRVRMN